MKSRTMLSLPALVDGGGRWTLPLCDATALAVAGALVDDSDSSRAAKLGAALIVDPAFAVWGVFHERRATLSIDSLAVSLAGRLIELLDQPDAGPITFSAEQHGRFAALVAESVATASETTRALGIVNANAQPEHLAALTGRWREWFEVCGSDGTESIDWPGEAPVVREPLSVDSRAFGDDAWRRWLTEIPGVHSLLLPLVHQLRQAAKFKSEFDDRLQTAKLDSLKEFAYGAGHELNNPLANIASRAQTLLREETQPDRRRRLAAINTQAFRAHEMLADVMLFARPPRLATEPVDLVSVADEVLNELAEDAAAQQTALHPPSHREPLMITADPVQLHVALRAMCVNSLEALGRAGNVTFDVSSPNDRFAEITISDDGPGISSEIREKIFDPFFSGREAGRGLGFGLSKAWRIVTLHGGQIVVHSQSGRGASFTIMLPTNLPQLSQQQATS